MTDCWWSAAQARLCKMALEEYKQQRAAWVKAGRSPNTFRYSVPEWQQEIVDALGRNDENDTKGLLIRRI